MRLLAGLAVGAIVGFVAGVASVLVVVGLLPTEPGEGELRSRTFRA